MLAQHERQLSYARYDLESLSATPRGSRLASVKHYFLARGFAAGFFAVAFLAGFFFFTPPAGLLPAAAFFFVVPFFLAAGFASAPMQYAIQSPLSYPQGCSMHTAPSRVFRGQTGISGNAQDWPGNV